MLFLTCAACNQVILVADNEPSEVMEEKLDEHIAICPSAQFGFAGDTDIARERADRLRQKRREIKLH